MKKIIALCVGCFIILTVATPFSLSGADTKPTTPTGKFVPTQLEGKIVAVDKSARLITVEIKGTLIKVFLTPQLRISKKGKPTSFEQLAPGQSILLSFVEMPNGRIEVASLALEPATEPVEPAGAKPGPPQPTHPNNSYWGNAPYGLPNPANVNGRANSAFK